MGAEVISKMDTAVLHAREGRSKGDREFTEAVGSEYLYRTSKIITKDFYDSPKEFQDAWCYPSIANKPHINLCMRPEIAKEKLSLKGVQMAVGYVKSKHELKLKVKAVVKDNEKGQMEYYKIGSEKQEEIFPEIIGVTFK